MSSRVLINSKDAMARVKNRDDTFLKRRYRLRKINLLAEKHFILT